MESISEGNKLIEEFRGGEPRMKWIVDEDSPTYKSGREKKIEVEIDIEDMEYHSSWDWLMPVVKKIYDYLQNIERPSVNHCWKGYLLGVDIAYCIREVNIKKAREAVIEFIKWYNTQPKTDKIK